MARQAASRWRAYFSGEAVSNPAVPAWAEIMEPIPKEMLALVYRGANDLRLETLPVPRIEPHELLVKVAACGVCPTDIKKIQFGTVTPPRIFGHETSGTIVSLGAQEIGRASCRERVSI